MSGDVFLYSAIELENSKRIKFKVNGQWVKYYLGDAGEDKVVCEVDLDGAKVIRHTRVLV